MDCTQAVYSNDYIDIIVEQSDRIGSYPLPLCIQNVNEQYFVGYWHREVVPDFNLNNYTYTSVPKIFTLLDEQAMEASGILQIQNQPTLSLKGQGVLIGFIDTGIDYQNMLFRNLDGTSRIVSIWDQTIENGPAPEEFLYGTEYTKEQINEALSSDNPLQMVPTRDINGHGTYVASLAAGNANLENEFIGAAPYAGIAVVKLKEAKDYLRDFFFISREAVAFQENDIMAGIAYLEKIAYEQNMPLVICLGLGTNLGSHGGTSPLSSTLNRFVNKRLHGAVIAAGNEANKRHHFRGNILESNGPDNVEINVGENVAGFTLELWSDIADIFTVEIISPTGERVGPLSLLERFQEYTFIFENTRVSINKNISFASREYQLIFIRFAGPSQGIWNVRVYGEEVFQGIYNMWLPMQELVEGEVFFLRSNPDTTITVPGNARYPITVGGYDATNTGIYLNSGRGYTINGTIKPDFVAPAVDVAGAGLRNSFTERTGTSAAAAITAGAVALIMEWAIVRGNYTRITAGDMKSILIRGASREEQRTYPNREWGYGRLNLYEAFNDLRTL